ncbi:DUF6049 family protein [Streptomyces melanogenes]|uniref:DUF6049 family protein n=1 Tax=Streptomyces melanogenes TaxID=67326 RepID=UPI00167E011A|nr:DUF6049 family protein [Streptomyces melanogenes]GGP69844.1 hypothetical protein GCM10010278_54360 [Streptomyces melanogenes]
MAEAADSQGMGPSPARRWLRRTAALLVGAPLIAGLLSGTAATTAAHAAEAAAPNRAATGSRTVQVTLDSMSPSAPVKSDTLTISGTVTNTGKQAVTSAHVGLRVGQRLTGRTAIDDASQRGAFSPGLDPAEVDDKYTVKFPKLAPGISRDFTLSVPVSKLGLGGDGVYQLGVSLSGQTASQQYDQVLGIQRTFLPWQPEAVDGKKSQLTYMWPLMSSTHLTAQTGSDEQQTPVFADDALAAELAPGGRLERMVSLGSQLPVTWVIDPDLLATVDAMTRNYRVKSGDSDVPGTNQDVAKQWLGELEDAVQGKKVVAVPFADPDLASLAHRGKEVSGSLSHLQGATEVAEKTVETILHVTPSVDFAWPVQGAVDPSIVDVATSAGAHNVIARSDSLRETNNLSYSPSAARPIGGGTTAVVSDARLSTAFEGDMSRSGNSTPAIQEFLAQTLAITLQDTEKQRSVVVAPQRMPSASQAQTMASAIRALSAQRWTEPLDLTAAATAKPDARATARVPGSSSYPGSLRKQELPVQAFQDMKSTQGTLDKFKVILTAPDRVVTPFGNAINREMSTSWRDDREGAVIYRAGVQSYLDGLTGEVRLIQKSTATMSGRSATLAVTVQNQLVQPVGNLVLRLEPSNPSRLKVTTNEDANGGQPVKIDGGHSQSVKFTATANANGPVQVTARLYTQDGTPYGDPMEFTVKVSEITPTVMLVIAGGVLLLVLAGIRMYTQRKRSTARKAAGETGEGDGAEADGGDDPEQPSDPTPDTGPESGASPGTGEKVEH